MIASAAAPPPQCQGNLQQYQRGFQPSIKMQKQDSGHQDHRGASKSQQDEGRVFELFVQPAEPEVVAVRPMHAIEYMAYCIAE